VTEVKELVAKMTGLADSSFPPAWLIAEVRAALSVAAAKADAGKKTGDIHRARSKNFVEALADCLRAVHQADPGIAVLSKHFAQNRKRFGLNELLWDILVCRTAATRSAKGSKTLTYITKALLAVESEFARDSREALFDFNKLVLSGSDTKLFVGPRVADEMAFLNPLGQAAAHCGGVVVVALVPHPADWKPGARLDVNGYQWANGAWAAL
jgi:hypothetical protein